jgi:S-adenosylmethionine:diacylglycerol 3-amino-3-carboxypropyl transferase
MDRHARIDVFSLAAHRLAVARLREEPARVSEALEVLARWRQMAGGRSHSDPYWDEWERALRAGVDAVERTALDLSSHGATLRSVSPLGRFISAQERMALLRETRETA